MKPYTILYEDEWLIVIDKSAGLLVIPTAKQTNRTLSSFLNAELDKREVAVNAYPAHRLDRETSGVILYAKGKMMQQKLMRLFRDREIKKRYLAIVQGRLEQNEGHITLPLYSRRKARQESAQTSYRVLQRLKHATLVEVQPLTGRTNQIRIHFQKRGHPLVGESVYAFRKDFALRFKRVALHAVELAFSHPITGERVTFTSPLPEDMKKLIRKERIANNV